MLVSLAQIGSTDDKAHNLCLVRDAVASAADAGADLVLFPEYAMYEKKAVDGTFAGAAESLDGPFGAEIAKLASRWGVAIVAGMVEANPHGTRPYNTLIAVDRDGRLAARYRKMHLFDARGFRESDWIAPAPDLEPVTFVVGDIRVGLMTCYDLRFPELGRDLADAGADLVAVCSSWVPGEHKADHWQVLARARAIENAYYVAAVSQASPISIGRSVVCGPQGEVIAEVDELPQVVTATIDRRTITTARELDPALQNRRHSIRRGRPSV